MAGDAVVFMRRADGELLAGRAQVPRRLPAGVRGRRAPATQRARGSRPRRWTRPCGSRQRARSSPSPTTRARAPGSSSCPSRRWRTRWSAPGHPACRCAWSSSTPRSAAPSGTTAPSRPSSRRPLHLAHARGTSCVHTSISPVNPSDHCDNCLVDRWSPPLFGSGMLASICLLCHSVWSSPRCSPC